MANRKLASIRTITEIIPIDGADAIELIRVDGWRSVSRKGEFTVGQRVVFCEVDSFLPVPNIAWDFLLKGKAPLVCEGINGIRLRSTKIRGVLSQGVAFSLDKFAQFQLGDVEVGTDVTKTLGIIKYEPPIPKELAGQVKGGFNFGIPKTDEERIQNMSSLVSTEIAGRVFRRTQKLDGTSMTVYQNGQSFGICGRNWEYVETEDNALWYTARRYEIIDALIKTGRNLALQGELVGPGICKNKEKLVRLEFFLFRVWDIEAGRFLSDAEKLALVEEMKAMGAEIKTVPDLGLVTMPDDVSVDNLLAMARGPSMMPNTIREGDVYHRVDGGFSFKVINDEWLLKYESN